MGNREKIIISFLMNFSLLSCLVSVMLGSFLLGGSNTEYLITGNQTREQTDQIRINTVITVSSAVMLLALAKSKSNY